MLYTDGDFVTPADMAVLHGRVNEVASDAGVQLTGPGGIIARTMTEATALLMTRTAAFSSLSPIGFGAAHHRALLNTGTGLHGAAQRIHLSQIVIGYKDLGGISPLRDWIAALAVRNLFRAAINRVEGDDRFATQFRLFNSEQKTALSALTAAQLRAVFSPLWAPGATRIPGSGSFPASAVTVESGAGSLPTAPIYIAVTYVGKAYQSSADKRNQESAPSEVHTAMPPAGDIVRISIADLRPNPNTASLPTEIRSLNRIAAAGWNVYAGIAPDDLQLQTVQPIPIETQSFDLTDFVSGAPMEDGQHHDGLLPIPQRFVRA